MTKNYRVCFRHAAGHLVTRIVEASSKDAAVEAVRAQFPAVCFARLSSVTAL